MYKQFWTEHRSLWGPRYRLKYNININLREISHENVNLTEMASVFMGTTVNLQFLQ